jgi:V8-like Glu-specific endopeptidase
MTILGFNRIKLLMFFIAGLLSVALFIPGAIASQSGKLLAQAPSPQPRLIRDLREFGLNPTAEPIIPQSLGRSPNPSAGGTRGVIGQDDRVQMTNRDYPWSAIGRISGVSAQGENYICTGTLIAPVIVLTNAHCVVNEQNELSQQIFFEPNLINGQLQNEGDRAAAVSVFPGSDFSQVIPLPNPNDWALVELNQPLGDKYGTIDWEPLPINVLVNNPQRLVLAGYSFDVDDGNTASVHVGCSILAEQAGVFGHDCDMHAGASGGPILGQLEGEMRIVAVNSAEQSDLFTGEGIRNFATRIQQIVDWL